MTQREILKLTKNFQSTGIIDDSLVPFFDQSGIWIGDKIGWTYRTYVAALEVMKSAFLPAARRTEPCLAGKRLLTSFLWRESTPAYLPFTEVIGSVLVPSEVAIRAHSLRSVGTHFFTHSNKAILLPYLTEVRGNFDSARSSKLSAPRLKIVGGNCRSLNNFLPALEEVGGRYCIRWALNLSSVALSSVGGTLEIHKGTHIALPRLRTVGRNLVACDMTKVLRVPALESVGGDFFASGANFITTRRLKSVGGRIDSSRAPDFWRPSIACGGEWFMYPGDMERWERRKRAWIALRGDQGPLPL